jgi:hypothetical protein
MTYFQITGIMGLVQRHFTPVTISANTYEFFAYCAESLSKPLGSSAGVGGSFSAEVNLNTRFNFNEDHSGQFDSTNADRGGYWTQLLRSFHLKS